MLLCCPLLAGPLTIGTNEAKPEVHAAKEASTNSSAVKEEPKSRQSPLVILHGILRDVGSRLVLNEAVLWAKSATKKPDGRWAKLLRIEPSKTLSLGIRCCFCFPSLLHCWGSQLAAVGRGV
jgi:hypothetical protein